MQLKRMTFYELYSHEDFDALATRYTQESGVKDFGEYELDIGAYASFEEGSEIQSVGVFDGEKLVGYATVLKLTHFHFSKAVASIDMLFIDKPYRKGAIGLKLINECKRIAQDMGCHFMSASAPAGTRLAKLLSIIAKHTDNDYLFNLEK